MPTSVTRCFSFPPFLPELMWSTGVKTTVIFLVDVCRILTNFSGLTNLSQPSLQDLPIDDRNVCVCGRNRYLCPRMGHSIRQPPAPSLGNGIIHRVFIEVPLIRIRPKRVINKVLLGPREGALWDADPPGCGRGCVDYSQQQKPFAPGNTSETGVV